MAASLAFLEPCELPADAVEVARIGDAWGVKGWFKLIAYSASPEALFSCKSWLLLPPEKRAGALQREPLFAGTQLLRIREAKEHSDSVVARADGIDDRSVAEQLKGCRVFVPRSSFPTPDSNEFYWVDVIGCKVSNRESVLIGEVKDLLSTGPQTVLVVTREHDGKTLETLIPFVDAYVDSVNTADKIIVVDWQLDY
jgi:16S rRNA processing protein RimM